MTLRVGDEEGAVSFGRIAAFTVDSSGALYVADPLMHSLRRFGHDGTYLGTVARYGPGPKELRDVTALALDPFGRLLVREAQGAVKVFDRLGNFVGSWPAVPPSSLRGPMALRVLREGRIALGLPAVFPATVDEPVAWPRALYQVRTSEGIVVDTIWGPAAYGYGCGVPSEKRFRAGYDEDVRAAYLPKALWSLSPDRDLIIGCPISGGFDLKRAGGKVLRVSRSDWPRVKVSREERTGFLALARAEGEARRLAIDYGAISVPDEKPAFRAVLSGNDGTIWVIPSQPSQQIPMPSGAPSSFPKIYWWESSPETALVFRATGEFVGPVSLPRTLVYNPRIPSTSPPIFRGDTVWAVTEDSLQVQTLSRFVIEWNSRQ